MPLSVPLLLVTRGSDLNLVSGVYPRYCQPKPIARCDVSPTTGRGAGGAQRGALESEGATCVRLGTAGFDSFVGGE